MLPVIRSPCGSRGCLPVSLPAELTTIPGFRAAIPASHFKAIIRMRFCAKYSRENPRRTAEKLPMPETDLAAKPAGHALAAMLESARDAAQAYRLPGRADPTRVGRAGGGNSGACLRSGAPRPGLDAARGSARGRPLPLAERDGDQHRQRLFPNTGAWNLVLNAQGHIQGDLTVWRGGEEVIAAAAKCIGATASPERRPASGNAVCRRIGAGTGDCGRPV